MSKMGPHWMAVLGCLSVLVTLGHGAALTTPETLVVARSEEAGGTSEVIEETSPALESTTLTSEATPEATPKATTASEVTTEGPLPAIKLTEMAVRSEVALRYARTAVVTRVRNPAHRAQEATFRVLLPDTAFISGFTMKLDGKEYKAYVKEKEEAKKIYSDAVSQGIGAAHIAAKARDSNHFTVSVNVEGNTTAVFNLTYEELLARRGGVYNLAANLHPGALVPRLTVTVHIKEAQKITELRVPEVRTGNEIDATADDKKNSMAVIERCHDDREATITFTPDLDEQRRLMDIYAAKTKESQAHSNSHSWYAAEDQNEEKLEGVLGQFVVQYDVDRPKEGEILVNDGYFVHFFAPSSLPPLNKHVVFVLDTSGSMMDRKIVQLREAMQTILGELNRGDYFSIVEFASSVKVYDLKEADEPDRPKTYSYYTTDYNKPTTLVPPSPASEENVAKAKIIVSRLSANGGTNIASALNVAVDLIQKGVCWRPAPTKNTAEKSDGESAPKSEITNEEKVEITTIATQDDIKGDDSKKLEPIIIFLTDGDPTVGETDPTRIINRLTEKNFGENRASIFSLAFGEDADRKFLRKLSLRNEGFMRHIYEAADAALQLRDFYRQVSSPLLADVRFVYPPEQVKADSLTKHKFRTFYAGSETVVAGRVADAARELAPHVIGICGVDDSFTRKRYEIFPKVAVPRKSGDYLPLERMWAYLTVKQLLDERDAADAPANATAANDQSPEKKALAIALKYEFVTALTSLVVVKPNDTKAVDAESVDKPSNGYPSYNFGAVPLAAHGIASGPASHSLARPQFAYKAAFSSAIGQVQSPQFDNGVVLPEAAQEEEEDVDASLEYAAHGGAGQAGPSLRLAALSRSSIRFAQGSRFSAMDSGIWQPIHKYPAPSQSLLYPHSHQVPISEPASLPPPPSTVQPNAPEDSTSTDDLASFHLEDYEWVRPLLRPQPYAGIALPVTANNTTTTVILELIRDEAPKEAGGDAQCARATDGADGVCVYLTRCDAARDLGAAAYADTYCLVNNKYAGVCCPQAKVDLPAH